MAAAWEVEWRKRTKARGIDPDEFLVRTGRATPSAAPMPSAGGGRPRAGEPAVRPDRASREGVLSKQAALMTTLARISRSELKDEDKRKLYDTAGASESMVAAALRAISEDGEVQDVEAVASTLPERRSDVVLAGASNPSPQLLAAVDRLRAIEDSREQKLVEGQSEAVAQVEGQFQEMTRDDPWWMDTLMFVDRYTRSPVVAAFSQLGAVIDDELGYDPDGTKSVASWDRFWEQWQNNTMTSELMDPNMPGWARFLLGTTVDIALDPLTYLTGGSAAVAKVSGKGGVKLANLVAEASRLSASKAGKLAGLTDEVSVLARQADLQDAELFKDLVSRVGSSGGFGGLNKADRALAERALKSTEFLTGNQSLRGGVYFRLPGTEGFRIPVLSEVLQPVGSGITRGTGSLRRTSGFAKISHPFETEKRIFMREFASLDSEKSFQALSALRGVTASDFATMSYREQAFSQRGGLMLNTNRWMEKTKLTGQDLFDHIRGADAQKLVVGDDGVAVVVNSPIAELIVAEGRNGPTDKIVDGWIEWWASVGEAPNELLDDLTDLLGRPNLIVPRPDYVFNARLQAGSDLLDAAGMSGQRGANPVAPEKFASVAVGRNFRGVEIFDPLDARTVERYGAALGPEDQAIEILRAQARNMGLPDVEEQIVKLFSSDLEAVTSTYVNIMSSRVGALKFAQMLMADGVAVPSRIASNAKRLKDGKKLWRARERFLQRQRFPIDVASARAATAAAVAAGATPPPSVVASVFQAVDDIPVLRANPRMFDSLNNNVLASTAGVNTLRSEVATLGARNKQILDELADAFERLGREGKIDEFWDLTVVSVSASTKRLVDELGFNERRLAQLAAMFEPVVMARMLQSDALLAVNKTSILESIEKFKTLDVGLGKPNDEGLRSAFRNTEDFIPDKEQVVVEIANAERQLDLLQRTSSLSDNVRSLYDDLEDYATTQDDSYFQIMRAMTPDADGVLKMSDGTTAVWTRSGLLKGEHAFDRVGFRYQLSDDVGAGAFDDQIKRLEDAVEADVTVARAAVETQIDDLSSQVRVLRETPEGSPVAASTPERIEVDAGAVDAAMPAFRPIAEADQAVLDARTGQPFRARMFRGEGGNAQGSGEDALFGPALYGTPNRKFAENFGDVVEVDVEILNPLVLSRETWGQLTKEAGWPFPNIAGGRYTVEQQREWVAALRQLIESKGYDGVVAPKVVDGAYADMLGAEQVVSFAARQVDEIVDPLATPGSITAYADLLEGALPPRMAGPLRKQLQMLRAVDVEGIPSPDVMWDTFAKTKTAQMKMDSDRPIFYWSGYSDEPIPGTKDGQKWWTDSYRLLSNDALNPKMKWRVPPRINSDEVVDLQQYFNKTEAAYIASTPGVPAGGMRANAESIAETAAAVRRRMESGDLLKNSKGQTVNSAKMEGTLQTLASGVEGQFPNFAALIKVAQNPVDVIASGIRFSGDDPYVLLKSADDQYTIAVNASFYSEINPKHRFVIDANDTDPTVKPIRIMDGDNIVGMLMPIRDGAAANTAADTLRMLATRFTANTSNMNSEMRAAFEVAERIAPKAPSKVTYQPGYGPAAATPPPPPPPKPTGLSRAELDEQIEQLEGFLADANKRLTNIEVAATKGVVLDDADEILKKLASARKRIEDLKTKSKSEPFGFEAGISKPKLFTGANAEAIMATDMLHATVRSGGIVLKPVAQLDSVDKLMWNQTVAAISAFSKTPQPTSKQLEQFTERLDRMIRGFAQADPESLAARVAATSDTPSMQLLDSIVNVGALTRTERELLGDWDSLLATTRHNPAQVAASYRNRLQANGFDGVLLDNGKLRELVSFSSKNIKPKNFASRKLLELENAQAGVKERLSKIRNQERTLRNEWGFDLGRQTFDREVAEAAQIVNRKALNALNAKLRRFQQLDDADDYLEAPSELLDEIMFRDMVNNNFKYAKNLNRRAGKLQEKLNAAYDDALKQAKLAGMEPGPRNDNPLTVKLISELNNEADNWRLVAQADLGDADAIAAGMSRSYDELFVGNLAEQPGLAENLTLMMADGMKRLNNGAHAPEWIVDVVNSGEKFISPEATRKFLRALDYLTGVFKSYAVMTTGFITRNIVGAMMNNWLGLVNLKSYGEFFRAARIYGQSIKAGATSTEAFQAITKQMGPRTGDAYKKWLSISSAVSGGQAAAFAGDVGVSAAIAIERSGIRSAMVGTERGVQAFGKTFNLPAWNVRQSLRDNTATRAFFYANTRSEYNIRGVMAWDEFMRKGGDEISAAQRIYQYHFDYSAGGLGKWERDVFRRAIPFYVWMANNVPLQLKSLVTRPKVAASYIKVKQNMEELSEDEAIVPSYFSRLGGIRLPFKDADGNHMYFMPDLPVRDLGIFNLDKVKFSLNPIEMGGSIVEMNEVLSSINPWFKVPAETLLLERKVFTDAPFRDGYVPISKAVQRIPGLTAGLKLLGQYKVAADGTPMADEKVLYALESANPWLARLNRLFPADGDEALQARRMSTVLSIFVGVGFRTNSFRDQSNELFKRQDALDTELRKLESLGVEFQTATEIKRSDKEQAAIAGWEQMPAEANYMLNVLNSGDVDAIKELDGFGDVSAAELVANIQQYGEFTDLQDLGSADGVSQSAVTKALEALGERRSASLDFATADLDDLEAMPGIGPKSAPKIQAYARRNGGIGNLGELRQFGLSNKDIQALDLWLREEREFQRMLAGVR